MGCQSVVQLVRFSSSALNCRKRVSPDLRYSPQWLESRQERIGGNHRSAPAQKVLFLDYLRPRPMTQAMTSRWSLRPSARHLVLLGFTALNAHGFAVQAQQTPPQCPASQHFDRGMSMCMPDARAKQAETPPEKVASPNSSPAEAPSPSLPNAEPSSQPTMNMTMPMPGSTGSSGGAMVQLNQFALYSHTSGPRGQSRLTGPGMWMLMYDKDLSSRNHFSVNMMGTPEQLTVGDKGTPQLLQTENIDAMHPHDYIMAVEFRDSLTLDTRNKEKLTFLFAPRGEAAVGPVPFMHRESAEGNPDAPLGHALQDGFHDVSTVLGLEYQFARTIIEVTAFSGHDIAWPLPLHSPDSFSVRVVQNFDDHLSIGASYADALLPGDTGGTAHNHFVAAWLSGSYLIGTDTLKATVVWGRGDAAQRAPLNSFLAEAAYQRGRNKFYGRAEILQISPAQLELAIPSGATVPRWAGALTAGYERTVFEKNDLTLFAGGSYTGDFVPAEFEDAYGSDPGGVKVYLRVAFHGGIH